MESIIGHSELRLENIFAERYAIVSEAIRLTTKDTRNNFAVTHVIARGNFILRAEVKAKGNEIARKRDHSIDCRKSFYRRASSERSSIIIRCRLAWH